MGFAFSNVHIEMGRLYRTEDDFRYRSEIITGNIGREYVGYRYSPTGYAWVTRGDDGFVKEMQPEEIYGVWVQ